EPATSAVTGQRSNQLSYVPRVNLENMLQVADGLKFVTRLTTQPTAFEGGKLSCTLLLQHH
ncbi:MAG: hypothetical protein WA815_17845, partial [Terracidiphilus sp.]